MVLRPGTPIGEIVDSCRVWESHSDPDQNARKRIESESENQSGDSRSRERNRAAVVVDTREQEEVLLEEMLKFICRSILALGEYCLTEWKSKVRARETVVGSRGWVRPSDLGDG